MPSRRKPVEPPPVESRTFTVTDVDTGIAKLQKRIQDVRSLQGCDPDDAGAVLAIRNPHGHAFPGNTAENARDYLGFLSLLAKRLQGAKRLK